MKRWWLLAPIGWLLFLGAVFTREPSTAVFWLLVVPLLVVPVIGWLVSAPDRLGWPLTAICVQCRYDLQGLSARAACPECGSLERGDRRPSGLRSLSRGASVYVLGHAPALGLWATWTHHDEPVLVVYVLLGFAVIAALFGGAFALIDGHLLAVYAIRLRWFAFILPVGIESLWAGGIGMDRAAAPFPSSLVFAMMVIPTTVLTGVIVFTAAFYALTWAWKSK